MKYKFLPNNTVLVKLNKIEDIEGDKLEAGLAIYMYI